MSYKKWIYKYQFLLEEGKDLEIRKEENIVKFNDYFLIEEEKNSSNPLTDNSSSVKNPNLPGKNLYKALSKILHPDKGGDTEEFALISLMYKNEDTIGLYLKCEEYGVNVKKYINEDLINSFESLCSSMEKKHEQIQSTVSWVWGEEKDEKRKKEIEKNILKYHHLTPKHSKD